MNSIVLRWLILTAAILLAAYIVDGIQVSGFFSALATAAVLGLLNLFFRPILLLLTLPVNILTLGLFTFVINGFMLMLASGGVPGFHVAGLWAAVWGSLVISFVNWLSSLLLERKVGVGRLDRRFNDDRRQ